MKNILNFATPGIFILSSPSGGGKTTLVRFMQKKYSNLDYSVSVTTRTPRPGDRNGYDYNFISRAQFRAGIKRGAFAEWAIVHDNYYGTPVKNIVNSLKAGRCILLDLDVKGARNVKKLFPAANLIFVTAPSIRELRRRLIARGQDSIGVINRRLKNARAELRQMKYFDYLIVNDDLKKARKSLSAIYEASAARVEKKRASELAEKIISNRL